MGQIVSWLRQSGDNDFEKILSQVDEKIRRAEVALADIRVRQRSFTIFFYVYSVLGYFVYTVLYFGYLRTPRDPPRVWLLKALPVLFVPVMIVLFGRATSYLYRRKQVAEELHLEGLKKMQKLKVEELKRSTGYYATRNLIERYDPASREEAMEMLKRQQQKQAAAATPRDQRAMTTGRATAHTAPVMRHRNVNQHVQSTSDTSNPERTPESVQSAAAATEGVDQDGEDNVITFNPLAATPYPSAIPRTFMDRLFDTIVGQEDVAGPNAKYALICGRCYAHNGLALPDEFEDIQYVCPKCGYLNLSRRQRMNPKTPILSPMIAPLPDSVVGGVFRSAAEGTGGSDSPSILLSPPAAEIANSVQPSMIGSAVELAQELKNPFVVDAAAITGSSSMTCPGVIQEEDEDGELVMAPSGTEI